MALSRDEILKRDEMPTREVPVPEWGDGETVRVRCLNAAGRLEFGVASQKVISGEPGPNPTALLVALSAIDDHGARLFHLQDVDALAELRGDVIDRIATAVMELSGLGDDKVAEAEGNSEATPSGTSPSGSPETLVAPSPSSVSD